MSVMELQACIHTLISALPTAHAVISPGSRNAPVVYALDQSSKMCHSIVDERSAGFVALGIAKATRKPVILSCTSGTAALNYYPAIAEAFYARVPLIVITADRPPEAIDQWDGQAIRQKGVFDKHVRAQFQTPDSYHDVSAFADIAQRVSTCLQNEIDGPIHINIPIREPFYDATRDGIGESLVLPEQTSIRIKLSDIAAYIQSDFALKKVLVFHGMEIAEKVEIVTQGSIPELCDVTSHQVSNIHYWDAMLFCAQTKKEGLDFLKVLQPDVLITTGNTTVSKGLKRFLRHLKPAMHLHISSYDEVGDMFGTSPQVINPQVIKTKTANLPQPETCSDAYKVAWDNLTNEFSERFKALDWKAYNEFTATNYIIANLPSNAMVHLSNSMPVRYVSFLLNAGTDNLRVYSNRGTSGIDGSTSTAVGHALVVDEPVYLITGDVAFLYDVNALFNTKLPQNLKIIILNNASGGIFDMIDGPQKLGESIKYQTTPHAYNASHLAAHFQLEYFAGNTIGSFAQGLDDLMESDGAAILEVFTSSEKNQAFFEAFKSL